MALSRVRSLDLLQVIGLTRRVCVPPTQAVLDFMDVASADTDDNPDICCRSVAFEDATGGQIAALVGSDRSNTHNLC